jgi:secondary thiamine-phosphate synthase enzyme
MGAMIHREEITLRTKGETEVIDLSDRVRTAVKKSGISEGTVHLFVPGSTAGLTTIEHEPGCLRDLRAAFERVAPREGHYDHNERWGDGNGFSHVRAALLGPSITLPVGEGAPLVGTWQQVVLVDFDNRGRDRKIVVTVMGE